MSDKQKTWMQFWRRGIIGFPLIIGGLVMMFSALKMDNPVVGGINGGFGGFIILAGAIIIGPPIARLIGVKGGALYYPDGTKEGERVNFSLFNAMKKKGQYREAMEFLEEAVIEYSGDARIFLEMIDLVMHELNQPERAETIYKQGLLAMETDKGREMLEKNYAMLTGLGQIENLGNRQ